MNTYYQIVDDIYHQSFAIVDHFLDINHFSSLQKTAQNLFSKGNFRHARIGQNQTTIQNSQIRNDQIFWLDESSKDDSLAVYFSEINNIATTLNRTLYLGLIDFEAHFAVYKSGSFYKKHVDQFINTQDRKISCVFYLNEEWQESFGGELKLYNQQEKLLISVPPLGNRLICFSSDLPHEVCVTQETRYSIAGWFKTRSLEEIQPVTSLLKIA